MILCHKFGKYHIPLLDRIRSAQLKRELWYLRPAAGSTVYQYSEEEHKPSQLQGQGVGVGSLQESRSSDRRLIHISFGNLDNRPYESLIREIPIKVMKNPRQVSDTDEKISKEKEKSGENDQEFTHERAYGTHISTNLVQRGILSVGAAAAALLDPRRHDMVAVLGETTGYQALSRVYTMMVQDSEGQQVLMEKPRINSSTTDLSYLSTLPEDSLGYFYIKFLNDNNVTPDSRLPVQFVDDPELAYVMQRYREGHDLFHTILGMPTNMLGEVAVKWVEAIQTGLPMCYGAAIFGPLRFKPKQRQKYLSVYLPWALRVGRSSKLLMNMYFEKRWEQPIDEIRKEFLIDPFPKPV